MNVRNIVSTLVVFLIVCCLSSGLQFYVHIEFVRDALGLGWGGLVSPWVVGIEGFIYALPFIAAVCYFDSGVGFDVLQEWRFWLLRFLPFSVALCVGLTLTLGLDGGGTLLSRMMAR